MEQEQTFSQDGVFDFHWRFGCFEIATVREKYTNDRFRYDNGSAIRRAIPVELIKWDEGHHNCYVVAWWIRDDEGYELHFVGGRPFRDISPEEMATIWPQLQAAQTMLDAYFDATEES